MGLTNTPLQPSPQQQLETARRIEAIKRQIEAESGRSIVALQEEAKGNIPAPPVEQPMRFSGTLESGVPISREEMNAPAEGLVKFAKQAAIPTALMAGAALVPPAGPVIGSVAASTLAAESALGAIGETINQMLGITPRDNSQIVAGALAGPVTRIGSSLLIKAAKNLGKRAIPGAPIAVVGDATERAIEYPDTVRKTLIPGDTSDVLYSALKKESDRLGLAGVTIPMNKAMKRSNELFSEVKRIGKGLRAADENRAYNILKGFVEDFAPLRNKKGQITGQATGIDFETLKLQITALGKAISKADGQPLGALKEMRKAIMQDIEEAAKLPMIVRDVKGRIVTRQNLAPLKELYEKARTTFSKEMSLDDLANIIDDSSHAVQSLGIKLINGAQALDRFDKVVRKDDLFLQAFSQAERDGIRDFFVQLSKLPTTGHEIGEVVIAGSLGGMAGGVITGSPAGGALGAATGIEATRIIRDSMANPKVRALVLKLYQKKGFLDRPALAVIGQAIRSGGQISDKDLRGIMGGSGADEKELFPPGQKELRSSSR